MFGLIRKMFFTGLVILSTLTSVNLLSCISMNNQECKVRPYAKLCVSDVAKNLGVKVFNIISRTNETRHIKWHKTCKCKCKLDASVSNNKQRWNDDKCRCESKELIDNGICDKGSIWNPINCKCECDKSCDIGEYLDYENCKCREKLVDKLVEKYTETVEEINIVAMALFEHGSECVYS